MPTDEKGMFLMDTNAAVHKYLGNHPLKTLEEVRKVIQFVRQQYTDLGIGRWAVLEKETNEFVGWTGFKYMQDMVNKHVDHYDFGYRLRQEFWGKGYATESALAALKYGITTLRLKDIYAMTDIDNLASRHVLEKIGFTLVEIFKYDAEPTWREPDAPTTWYEYKQ